MPAVWQNLYNGTKWTGWDKFAKSNDITPQSDVTITFQDNVGFYGSDSWVRRVGNIVMFNLLITSSADLGASKHLLSFSKKAAVNRCDFFIKVNSTMGNVVMYSAGHMYLNGMNIF